VRVAVDGPRLVVDRQRQKPGRGAYVHPDCGAKLDAGGLAKSLRRKVTPDDVKRIVTELSRGADNSKSSTRSAGDPSENPDDLKPGLAGAITVETTPRIKAKDDRSEDARV
jgi:predicted RNA-binding protein YlxR (DUF448 family)